MGMANGQEICARRGTGVQPHEVLIAFGSRTMPQAPHGLGPLARDAVAVLLQADRSAVGEVTK